MAKSQNGDSKVIPIRVKKDVVDILDKLVELGFVGHVVPLASCYASTALVEL